MPFMLPLVIGSRPTQFKAGFVYVACTHNRTVTKMKDINMRTLFEHAVEVHCCPTMQCIKETKELL